MTPALRRVALHGVFGWRATDLARAYSVKELADIAEAVESEPGTRTPADAAGHPIDTIWVYTPAARKKLDALSWAVTYRLREERRAEQARDRAE